MSDFSEMIENEFGEKVQPTMLEKINSDIAAANERINAMSDEARLEFVDEVLGGLELAGLVTNSQEGTGILMPHACYDKVVGELESVKPGLSKDLAEVAMGVASHLSMGHLTTPWDPVQWVVLYRLALVNLRANAEG